MILAETLKCTVPSPNAVKDAVIYCVTNPTNATDISTSIATWATAGITFMLALFAWLAWKAAQRNLRLMQDQVEATIKSSETVVKNDIEGRQIQALADYLRAWGLVVRGLSNRSAPMNELVPDAISAGMIWRMHHLESGAMVELFYRADSTISEVLRLHWDSYSTTSTYDWNRDDLMAAVVGLASQAQIWQTNPWRREESLKSLTRMLEPVETELAALRNHLGPEK